MIISWRKSISTVRAGLVLAVLAIGWAGAGAPSAAAGTPPPVSNWVLSATRNFTPVVGTPQICGGQGIASDGKSLWFSWNFGLSRNDLDLTKSFAARCIGAIPDFLASTQHNHIGDIDVYRGILYAPIEDGPAGYLSPWIALYNADDLSFTGKAYELDRDYLTEGVPWVAIDGPRKVAYTAEWNNTTKLNVHRLSDFRIIRTVDLDQTVPRIQGAKVFRGSLYLSRDDGAEKSIDAVDPETGHVTHLFDRNLGVKYETEGIAFIRRPSGTVMSLLELYEGTQGDPGDPPAARLRDYRINGDTTAPVLTGLKLNRAKIRSGKRAATLKVRVTASEPVTVTGRWLRCTGPKRKPCSRLKSTGKPFTRSLDTGAGQVTAKAAASGRKLSPGRWCLRLTPVDEADITGRPAEAGLTVLPARKK